MDSKDSFRRRPRPRGKPSATRRTDAFRLRLAQNLPSQRQLMDAKYMNDDMNNAVALTDYLGKFCLDLSVSETKSLICLAIEDPSHPTLQKYWDAIEGRDPALGDTSDDDVQDIITCTLVDQAAKSAKDSVVSSTSSALSTTVMESSAEHVRKSHASCILSDEEGKVFKQYLDNFGALGECFFGSSAGDVASPMGVRLDSPVEQCSSTPVTVEGAASDDVVTDIFKMSMTSIPEPASYTCRRRRAKIHRKPRVGVGHHDHGRTAGAPRSCGISEQFSKKQYELRARMGSTWRSLLVSCVFMATGSICLVMSLFLLWYAGTINFRSSSAFHDSDQLDSEM